MLPGYGEGMLPKFALHWDSLFGAGKAAKRDRSEQLDAYTGSRNLFNFALPTAEAGTKAGAGTTGTGTGLLGKASDYWGKLMGGNRAATQQAVAPVINQQASAADAGRRQLDASGTARGGGVAGAEQDAKQKQQATIDNLLFGAQSEGASKTGEIGGKLAQVGLGQTAEAANQLGIAGADVANRGKMAIDARDQNAKINSGIVSNVTGGIEAALGFFV